MRRVHDSAEREWIVEYIAELRDLMGLGHFTVTFQAYPPAEQDEVSTAAQIQIPDGKRDATIQVDPDFVDEPPEEQRETLVHELVHCHLADMGNMVYEDLKHPLGITAHAIFNDGFTRALEHATDAIAKAWAAQLPLPAPEHRAIKEN